MCITFDNQYTLSKAARVKLSRELNIDNLIDAALDQLYDDRRVNDETNFQLFKTHFEPLKKAVEEGYGKPLIKIEYGTPNYEFLKQLQTNTAVFAIFKNHASVKEMAALLKDADGKLRSREDFKREALKVDDKYRGSWLDTEYDTAVRTARMAANWQKWQKTKKLYPNLKFTRSKAAKPDAKHLQYVGIVASKDDPFWNTHLPPLREHCQCGAEETDEEATDIPANLPEVPERFAFNAGKTGQVFDLENSAYIKSVPAAEQPALIKKAQSYVVKEAVAEAPYQQLYSSKKGGSVEAHPVTFNNSDFNNVLKLARQLANEGHTIKMLPDINDPELRSRLLPDSGVKGERCPDYLINNSIVADGKEVKGNTRNTISHTISQAKKQCNNVIIDIPEDSKFTKFEVIKYVKAKMKQAEMKDFGDVWVNYKGDLLRNPHKKK